ncbi:hypothetical protein ABZZ80_46830, partial [Streptomyces sp. NPDC006356]
MRITPATRFRAVEFAVVLGPVRDVDPQPAELRGELVEAVVRCECEELFVQPMSKGRQPGPTTGRRSGICCLKAVVRGEGELMGSGSRAPL